MSGDFCRNTTGVVSNVAKDAVRARQGEKVETSEAPAGRRAALWDEMMRSAFAADDRRPAQSGRLPQDGEPGQDDGAARRTRGSAGRIAGITVEPETQGDSVIAQCSSQKASSSDDRHVLHA